MITYKIRELLLCLSNEKIITISWGMEDIVICKSKVTFFVCGFKYIGIVEIEAAIGSDGYTIFFENEIIRDCKLSNIVSLLDEKIECCESSYQKLAQKVSAISLK